MKCPPAESLPFAVLILLNRASLGFLFFCAGLRKLLPDAGQAIWLKLDRFATDVASQAPLPQSLGTVYGYALPFMEVVAGLLVVVGLWGRVGACLIALLLVSFMIALGIDFWPAQGSASPFNKNVIFFTLALLLLATGSGRLSLDHLIRCRSRSR